MSKEIHFKVKQGIVDSQSAPNRGSIDVTTGAAAASQLAAELSGRYGEELNDRPTIVIPFDSESAAEDFKSLLETFSPEVDLMPKSREEYVTDEEKEEMKAKWTAVKETYVKPNIKRIGNELVLTRSCPIEELTGIAAPAAAILNSSVNSFHGEFAFDKTMQHVTTEKKHPLFYFWNGASADVTVTLNQNLVESVTAVMGMDDQIQGKIPAIAYKFFKKFSFEVETDDISTLPNVIQKTMDSDTLKGYFNFWGETVKAFSEMGKLGKVMTMLSNVEGEINIFFPLADVGALRVKAFSNNFFNTLISYIAECEQKQAAANE
jgi:hypothetical protein